MRNKDKLDILVKRLPKGYEIDRHAAGYRLQRSGRDLSPRLPIKAFTEWIDAFLTGIDETLIYSDTAKATKEFVTEHASWVGQETWDNAPQRSDLVESIAGFVERLAETA